MTFTQFIKQLSSEQVNTWWQTIAPNQAPEKIEEDNWKYKLSKNYKALPFKWTITELAKYHNIPFSNKDFDSNVTNRDAFCEAFDFEIEEDLVYDDFENKGFQDFYAKRVSNKQLFQSFIEYGNKLINDCNINPYKIRMAISSDKKNAMLILGMRAVLQYSENNSNTIIGFILQKEFVNKLNDTILESTYPFKGNDTSKVFASISISNWSDVPQNVLENNLISAKEQYELINNSKRATWNTEANTTNSVLKYLIFKNENVESWIENNRPINFWVFQGNPKEFDIVKALEDDALKTWRIKAHKDKINKGDKVILWAGGKNSGVYALATVNSEVIIMPEPEIEKYYYKDQTVYEDKERVFLNIDYNLFNQPVLKSELENYTWFSKMKVGSQGTNFTATKEEYESIKSLLSKMNKLIINISWNSKDWKEESQDKSNHEWVKNGGIPFESWNFAHDAEENTEQHIYGYAKFTNNPKITGKSIFIFYSDKKIVGFYGNGAIVEKKVKDNVLNLRGDQNISFVLENKIEDIVDKGYLEDGKRIGQGGFNYLHKNETILKILEEALLLNPNQKEEIIRLKEWFMKETQSQQYNDKPNIPSNIPLNQILYGPPGTGKTYNSINKAIEIINPSFDLNQDRKIVKNEFDRLISEGQIIFTTFHQSMTYEDFIEGIKPKIDEDSNENKQVVYEIEDGIFKQLVENAKKVKTASKEIIENYSFEDAWDDLVKEAERNIENSTPLFLSIQTPNLGLKIIEISERGNLKLKPIYSEDAKEYTVSYSRAKKLQEAFPVLSVVKNIDKEFRAVIGGSNSTAYWSILNFINQKIHQNSKIIKQENTLPALPHVLIIDEINRGNVSQIFGELITLIEESKRLGEVEALEVTLSYSKKKFGVPSNVYIIGTMNTADRSVEALDTALRRRFSFVEMMPNEEIFDSLNFTDKFNRKGIMKKINQRIEVLLDRNYTLGHSYFIKEDFKNSFENEIIPLLQEYFYNDYGKIGLVLGKGFVRENDITAKNDKSIFADFDTKNEVDINKSYELIPFTEINFDEAIQILLA